MTTVRQIDRLWAGRDHRRLIAEVAAGKPEITAVAQRLLGPVAAAAVAIIRLDELGQSHQPIVASLIRSLIGSQAADGGWGDVAVTVLAVRALRCCRGQGAAVDRGIEHLLSLQKDDGAWPVQPMRRLQSDGLTTAFVLVNLALDSEFGHKARISDAIDWLAANRDAMEPNTQKLADRAVVRCASAAVSMLQPSWS